MKKTNPLQLFLVTLCFAIPTYAQLSLDGFSKITNEQLELKSVEFEKDADAVILDEEAFFNVYVGGYQLKVKRRIKILNEKAFDVANIEILYYSKDKTEKISKISAQTINSVDGSFEHLPVNSKDIFDVEHHRDYNAIRFTFPNVKVGSILEYQYTLTSNNIYFADPWYFQHEIPTLKSKFSSKIQVNGLHTKLLIGNRIMSKYPKFDKWLNEFELSNIPSLKEVKYAYNPKKRAESIRLQFTKFDTYPEFKKDFEKYNLLNESEFAIKKYAQDIPDGKTEMETLFNVMKQFKKDFRWDNYRGIIANNSQRVTLNTKVGNLAELNTILKDILKQKGFKTNLILLSSRIHDKNLNSIPYIDSFDYLVNYIELKNGDNFIVNAVDIPENDLRFADLNLYNDKAFLLDDSKEGRIVVLNQFLSEYTADFKYTFRNGQITEIRKDAFNGFFYDKDEKDASVMVQQYIKAPIAVDQTTQNAPLNYSNNRYVVGHFSKSPIPTNTTFFQIENPLEDFLMPLRFDELVRQNPIEFDFPYLFKINVMVEIPSDYEVIVPTQFEQTIHQSNDLVYAQRMIQKENQLNISYELYLGKAVFEAKDYALVKQFFETAQKKAVQQITLKKK